MPAPEPRGRSGPPRPSHPKWQAVFLIAMVVVGLVGLAALSTFGGR